jgi:hypothetical protein
MLRKYDLDLTSMFITPLDRKTVKKLSDCVAFSQYAGGKFGAWIQHTEPVNILTCHVYPNALIQCTLVVYV